MYAHKVIDSLKKIPALLNNDSEQIRHMFGGKPDLDIRNIFNSQKFHIGDFDNVREILKNKKGKKLFIDDEFCWGVRLPYKICWFDYISFDEANVGHKRAILVKEIKSDLLFMQLFNEIKQPGYPMEWGTSACSFYVSIGKAFQDRSDFDEIGFLITQHFSSPASYEVFKKNWFPEPCFMVPRSKMYEERLFNADARTLEAGYRILKEDLSALNATLMFLNCKNIGYQENFPPEKLNKKRIKNKKTPLFSYKTLILTPSTKKEKNIEKQGFWENRVHLCRGHFKTYTDARPLLGKHTGRFWWQPFARGNKEKGVVVKDYKVELSTDPVF